jgi:hypothetical protein
MEHNIFFEGKSTISMAIFNSNVNLLEGTSYLSLINYWTSFFSNIMELYRNSWDFIGHLLGILYKMVDINPYRFSHGFQIFKVAVWWSNKIHTNKGATGGGITIVISRNSMVKFLLNWVINYTITGGIGHTFGNLT